MNSRRHGFDRNSCCHRQRALTKKRCRPLCEDVNAQHCASGLIVNELEESFGMARNLGAGVAAVVIAGDSDIVPGAVGFAFSQASDAYFGRAEDDG